MVEQPVLHEKSVAERSAADWTRQPIGVFVGWVLPIVLGVSSNLLPASLNAKGAPAFVWAGALAWMGVSCLLNARRCRRLHCYLAAPILLIGALLAMLLGLDVISLGPHGLNYLISVTFGLALLSYVSELFLGRYARP